MTIIKRIAVLTVCAVVFAMSMACVNTSAEGNAASKSICIRTKRVPDDVVDYAIDIFSSLCYEDMFNLGFNRKTVSKMRLGYPFDINDAKSYNSIYERYYFPIINNNKVVAVMSVRVNTVNNSMNYHIGKTELSKALNRSKIPTADPVEIYMNDDCCYALNTKNGHKYVLYVFREAFYKYAAGHEYETGADIVKITENAYVKTEKAPDEVVEFAEELFSGLYYNYMTLCEPFHINMISKKSEYEHYYFPIVNNDKIVSMMTISYNTVDKKMGYSVSNNPDKLSKALNKMSSSREEPIEIFINDFCCYAVKADGYVQTLYVLPEAYKAVAAYYITYDIIENSGEADIIYIDSDNVFDETLRRNISRT